MDGTLSWQEFVRCANQMVAISDGSDDKWTQQQLSQEIGGTYLRKIEYKSFPYHTHRTQKVLLASDTTEDECLEDTDSQCAVVSPNQQSFAKFEYHIVYSISYSVPVLYFTINKPDGSLARLEEIWQCVPQLYCEGNSPNDVDIVLTQQITQYTRFGDMLTQMEHPLLGKPYFAIHPCHTSTLMKNIINVKQCDNQTKSRTESTNSFNYIIAWLSAIGPIVGISLRLEYGKSGAQNQAINITDKKSINLV